MIQSENFGLWLKQTIADAEIAYRKPTIATATASALLFARSPDPDKHSQLDADNVYDMTDNKYPLWIVFTPQSSSLGSTISGSDGLWTQTYSIDISASEQALAEQVLQWLILYITEMMNFTIEPMTQSKVSIEGGSTLYHNLADEPTSFFLIEAFITTLTTTAPS